MPPSSFTRPPQYASHEYVTSQYHSHTPIPSTILNIAITSIIVLLNIASSARIFITLLRRHTPPFTGNNSHHAVSINLLVRFGYANQLHAVIRQPPGYAGFHYWRLDTLHCRHWLSSLHGQPRQGHAYAIITSHCRCFHCPLAGKKPLRHYHGNTPPEFRLRHTFSSRPYHH